MARKADHFGRFNALCDNGWLAVLNKAQLGLWMAYEGHADTDGFAHPGSDLLAKKLGHSTNNHISKIRESLVRYGLMEIIDKGGGRANPTKVRLVVPPDSQAASDKHSQVGSVSSNVNTPESSDKHSQRGSVSGSTNTPKNDDKHSQINTPKFSSKHSQNESLEKPETLPNSSVNTPKFENKHSQIDVLHNKEEQIIQQPIEQPSSAAGGGTVEFPVTASVQIREYWNLCWRETHGTDFPWGAGGTTGTALAGILEHMLLRRETPKQGEKSFSPEERLERSRHNAALIPEVKKVIDAYMADRSSFYEGHSPLKLRSDIHKFIARAAAPKGQNGTHRPKRPTAVERGEFPENRDELHGKIRELGTVES